MKCNFDSCHSFLQRKEKIIFLPLIYSQPIDPYNLHFLKTPSRQVSFYEIETYTTHYRKKYNIHCPKHLKQHQYTSSNILDSYNLFGQEEENDEHVLKTPRFHQTCRTHVLKNIPYRLTPFRKKLGKYYKFFTIIHFFKK